MESNPSPPITSAKLFNKNFILYLLGMELSWTSYFLLTFTLPLYVLSYTANPALMGQVMGLSVLPFIVLSPVGGVLADRYNKGKMLALCNLLLGISVATYTLLQGTASLVILSVAMLAILFGLDAVISPAAGASVAMLVPENRMVKANSVIELLSTFSFVGSPLLAGVMLHQFGIMPILWVVTGLYGGAFIFKACCRVPSVTSATAEKLSITSDLKAAIHYLRHEDKSILRVIALMSLLNFTTRAFTGSGMSVLVALYFERSQATLGVIQSVILSASVLGALVMSRYKGILSMSWLIMLCGCLMGLVAVLFSLFGSSAVSYYGYIGGAFVAMIVFTILGILFWSHMGEHTPKHMVGKIMALALTAKWTGIAISDYITGWLYYRFLEQPYFIIGGFGLMLVAVGIWDMSKHG